MKNAVSIYPVPADIVNTLNEFGKGAWFYHITVRAARITAGEVGLVVGGGKDDGGDRREARVGSEPFQKVAAVLAAKIKIQENQG
jgi:hypothetical protein